MNPTLARLFTASTALGLVVLEGSTPHVAHALPPLRGSISFTTSTDNNKGHVICALFDEQGWLDSPLANVKSALRAREASCVFQDLKPGAYAIVAFHDENDNGDIDKNFIGIPTESWCASRNAPAIFGPPSFGSAKVQVGTVRLQLRCRM
jgi:uncharacterized protein (DUF2141 family)